MADLRDDGLVQRRGIVQSWRPPAHQIVVRGRLDTRVTSAFVPPSAKLGRDTKATSLPRVVMGMMHLVPRAH
eukprot:scaffold74518_cov51-Phaeocystis_antarctica.AAC.1